MPESKEPSAPNSAATLIALFLLAYAATPAFAQTVALPADPQTASQTSGDQQQTTNPQTTNQPNTNQQTAPEHEKQQINVNWLYGSFVPRDVPLVPLTPHQRFKLYVRQTYLTWGIYFKTVVFAADGQIRNSPPQWDGASGFGKRALSYQGQFIIQNSITSAANAVAGWEPRYERCRCDGVKARTWHAIKRNFVTYDSTDTALRPQLMPYLGASGAAAIAATAWLPGNPRPGVKAYQAAITQVFVGVSVNLVAEYAPEIMHLIHKDKNKDKDKRASAGLH